MGRPVGSGRTREGTKDNPLIVRSGPWKNHIDSGGRGAVGRAKARGWRKGWMKKVDRLKKDEEKTK